MDTADFLSIYDSWLFSSIILYLAFSTNNCYLQYLVANKCNKHNHDILDLFSLYKRLPTVIHSGRVWYTFIKISTSTTRLKITREQTRPLRFYLLFFFFFIFFFFHRFLFSSFFFCIVRDESLKRMRTAFL